MCKKKTVADYPELVAQWHWEKNGDLKPEDFSYGSHKKVWWKCPVANDHEWEASPNHRCSHGRGCPCCSNKKVCNSNCLATTHPKLSKEWHPIKNGNITPYDIVAGSDKKVWWQCDVVDDHEWEARVVGRSKGRGCPCCTNKKVCNSNCLATTHPKLSKEWHPTKNGKLTPYDIVAGSNNKVWWKCPVANYHEWEASPNSRCSNGSGCPCCANQKVCKDNCLATTHPELAKEWHPIKNGNITPYDIVAGSVKKYWWKCSVANYHEWEVSPNSRYSNGSGCPCCANQKVCKDNCLATTHPKLSKEWHPTKNGKLTPYDIVAGSHTKVWWKCNVVDDHEWEAQVVGRSYGQNCPCCTNKKVCKDNCLATTHPKLSKQWHPTKNGKLTPYDIVAGSNNKVWWKCPVANDHEWEARVVSRSYGQNCPCCTNKKVCKDNCLATTHPKLSKQWHPTKNGKLTPYDIVAGSNNKVWWKCPVANDHEWEATIINRFYGSGCPCCSGRKPVLSNCLATTHPKLSKQWHPTKNGKLTPYDIVAGSNNKVWWKCSVADDHEWEATISNRYSGTDCPICKESKGEKEITCYLNKNKITFKPQYSFKNSTIKRSKFDFATQKGLIEYHGEQHYLPVSFGSKDKYGDIKNLINSMKRDLKKEWWCKKYNVPLLVVPYWDYDRISEILDDYFADKKPKISDPPDIVIHKEIMRKKIIEKYKLKC